MRGDTRRLNPEKIGFWVWVLGWVLYPNPKIFILKPKTQKLFYPKPDVSPKKIRVLGFGFGYTIFWVLGIGIEF